MADGDIKLSVTLETSDIKAKANQLRESISSMLKGADPGNINKTMQGVLVEMDKLVSKSVEVQTSIERMENTTVDNPVFVQLENQITGYLRALENLDNQKSVLTNLGLPTDEVQASIEPLEEELGRLLVLREQMVQAGQATTTWAEADPDTYNKYLNQLGNIDNRMAVLIARYQQAANAGKKMQKSFNGVSSSSNRLAKSIRGSSRNIQRSLSQAFSISGISQFIRKIAQLAFGVYSVTAIFNKLKQAAKEGLNNLVQFQSKTNTTNKFMTDLQTSLLYLKNAWGAAFAPIINYVMPVVTTLLNLVATAGNAIARLIGMLTGQTKVLQAVKVSAQDYAESLNSAKKNATGAAGAQKKLNDRLAQFDDLNVLGKDSDTGGGGGSGASALGGPDPSEMFKYVDVDENEFSGILGIFDKIKQRIEESGILDSIEKLKAALKDFKDSPFIKTLQKIVEILTDTAFTSVLSILSNTISLIANIISGDLNGSLNDLKDILADLSFDPLIALARVFDAIFGTDIAGWLEDIKEAIKDFDLSELDGYDTLMQSIKDLTDAWNNLKQAVSDLWDTLDKNGSLTIVKDLLVEFIKLNIDVFLQGVAAAITLIADALQIIADILNGDFPAVLEDIKNTLADINFVPLETVASVIDKICGTDIQGWLEGVHQKIEELGFSDVVQQFVTGWEQIKSAFWLGVGVIAAVFGITDEKFQRIRFVVQSVMLLISDVIHKTWESIKQTFSTVLGVIVELVGKIWGKIVDKFKGPISLVIDVLNILISAVEKAINGVADVLRNFKIDIPNWVPEWGGKSLKIDIPKVTLGRIPKLAQGAVIPPNNEFLAVLGDQSHGTNIEAPLDTIKQAVAEVMGNNSNQEVVQLLQQLITVVESKNLTIGDKEIGKANARYVNQQKLIRGTSF